MSKTIFDIDELTNKKQNQYSMSWKEINLGDVIFVKHGFAFKSEYFTDNGSFIVLTPGNFYEKGGFRLRPGKDRFYQSSFPEDYLLDEGQVLIAMTEQGEGLLGSSALIPESNKYLHNQRLGLICEKEPNVIDIRFIYYLFNTNIVRGQIRGSATGTKVKHTAPERIHKVKVKIPRFNTQQKISSILSAYDDLIENNRRRIALLEQSARLLYQEWFVRFHFPGHEHVRMVDGLPEGWVVKTLEDITSFVSRGITPIYAEDGESMVINQKCIRNKQLYLSQARRQNKEFNNDKQIQYGDILINSTGTGTLGRVAQVLIDIPKCTFDSHVSVVRPQIDIDALWFGFTMLSFENVFESMGEGSTNQTELNKSKLLGFKVCLPSKSIRTEFSNIVKNSVDHVTNLKLQITHLQKARDILLPRLMSGELGV